MDEHRDTASEAEPPRVADIERAAAAEFLGSFFLVFIAAGSVIVAGTAGSGLVGVAIASGSAFTVAVAATEPVSGGGVNPIVTAGLWVAGRLSSARAGAYIGAQLLGGVVAAALLRLSIPQPLWRAANLGAPLLADELGAGRGVLIEALLSFVLTVVAFATIVDGRTRSRALAGPALGLTLAAGILVAWPLTGAAFNPARSVGPELVSGIWRDWWIYWIGPTAGAVVAAVLYWSVFLREPRRETG